MNERTRRRIADGLERTRLLGAAERVRGVWYRARDRANGSVGPDGLPLPQLRLPFLFQADLGPDEVEELARSLRRSVAALAPTP